MATADELLYEAGSQPADFIIDLDRRTIKIPDGISNLGVESDDEVLTVQFRMASEYCGVDLSKFHIWINYTNAADEPDAYDVRDAHVDDDGTLVFSWLVGRHAAIKRGNVKFSICMKDVDETTGKVLREFNTSPATLPILEGLETGPQAIAEYIDLLEQWRAELFEIAESARVTVDHTPVEGSPNPISSGCVYAMNDGLNNDIAYEIKPAIEVLQEDVSALKRLEIELTLNPDGETLSASHTAAQIYERVQNGAEAVLIYEGLRYFCLTSTSSSALFTACLPGDNLAVASVYILENGYVGKLLQSLGGSDQSDSGTLMVVVDADGLATSTPDQIREHMERGGCVKLLRDEYSFDLMYTDTSCAVFTVIDVGFDGERSWATMHLTAINPDCSVEDLSTDLLTADSSGTVFVEIDGYDANAWSASLSAPEIYEYMQAGRSVVARKSGNIYLPVYASSSTIRFVCNLANEYILSAEVIEIEDMDNIDVHTVSVYQVFTVTTAEYQNTNDRVYELESSVGNIKPLVIKVTKSNGELTATHSHGDIYNARLVGRDVIADYDGQLYHLTHVGEQDADFACLNGNPGMTMLRFWVDAPDMGIDFIDCGEFANGDSLGYWSEQLYDLSISVGDIDTALDAIIAIQNELIGGGGGGGGTLISFTTPTGAWEAVEGMTWGEWIRSEYNTNGFYLDKYNQVCDDDGIQIFDYADGGGAETSDLVIMDGHAYIYD